MITDKYIHYYERYRICLEFIYPSVGSHIYRDISTDTPFLNNFLHEGVRKICIVESSDDIIKILKTPFRVAKVSFFATRRNKKVNTAA